MISSAEASEIIFQRKLDPGRETIPMMEALGRVLADEVKADRDFPPFHRVTMDGIAIRASDWQGGQRKFMVTGVQAAGDVPLELQEQGALEIMTGAVLPRGADAVIKVEECVFSDEDGQRYVEVDTSDVASFKNVHQQGSDRKSGHVLMTAGTRIGSPEIGVLATVGLASVDVVARPKVAIISTGDELVGLNETPLPHQIRRSNVFSIQAELVGMGYDASEFHLPDDKTTLEERISSILQKYPVIILSGGVSKGKFDYLPEVLDSLGVVKHFHRIAQRPGKPFWFGSSDSNVVFALPGNPVSTFMCFVKYVAPWLKLLEGTDTTPIQAKLGG